MVELQPGFTIIGGDIAVAERLRAGLGVRLACLLVMSAALAFIEADVVVYLRQVLAPHRQRLFPDAVGEALPLLSRSQLDRAGPEVARLLLFEQVRELAALVVLAAMAVGLRGRRGEAWAFGLIGFAVWDILYYVFLKVLIGWPASLATWDVLFLIPVPWVAPVWAPLTVSATLLLAGLVRLGRRRGELSAKAKAGAALAVLMGAGLVLGSFIVRVAQAVGGVPERFDWPWFLAGWLLGVVGLFWLAVKPSGRRR